MFLISGNSGLQCFPRFFYYVITLISCLQLSLVMLGSNDPNTISDPTRIRCSRSRIVFYVSARTPVCCGLSYVYVPFGLCDSPVTSLVT